MSMPMPMTRMGRTLVTKMTKAFIATVGNGPTARWWHATILNVRFNGFTLTAFKSKALFPKDGIVKTVHQTFNPERMQIRAERVVSLAISRCSTLHTSSASLVYTKFCVDADNILKQVFLLKTSTITESIYNSRVLSHPRNCCIAYLGVIDLQLAHTFLPSLFFNIPVSPANNTRDFHISFWLSFWPKPGNSRGRD